MSASVHVWRVRLSNNPKESRWYLVVDGKALKSKHREALTDCLARFRLSARYRVIHPGLISEAEAAKAIHEFINGKEST